MQDIDFKGLIEYLKSLAESLNPQQKKELIELNKNLEESYKNLQESPSKLKIIATYERNCRLSKEFISKLRITDIEIQKFIKTAKLTETENSIEIQKLIEKLANTLNNFKKNTHIMAEKSISQVNLSISASFSSSGGIATLSYDNEKNSQQKKNKESERLIPNPVKSSAHSTVFNTAKETKKASRKCFDFVFS